MRRITRLSFVLILAAASTAFAINEIAGRWSGKLQGPDGPTRVVYTLRPIGDSIAGDADFPDMGGGLPIIRGRIKGDSVFFTAEGSGYTLVHSGRVSGDSLHLSLNGEQTYTVVRVKE